MWWVLTCCRMFSTIPGLYPVDTIGIPISTPCPVVTTKSVPIYCQMSEGKIALVESHRTKSMLKFILETEALKFMVGVK